MAERGPGIPTLEALNKAVPLPTWCSRLLVVPMLPGAGSNGYAMPPEVSQWLNPSELSEAALQQLEAGETGAPWLMVPWQLGVHGCQPRIGIIGDHYHQQYPTMMIDYDCSYISSYLHDTYFLTSTWSAWFIVECRDTQQSKNGNGCGW